MEIIILEDELHETIEILTNKSRNLPTIVILGSAKARAVNFILGENILPSLPQPNTLCNNWRGVIEILLVFVQFLFVINVLFYFVDKNSLWF